MLAIKRIFGWLGGKAILYLALVAAILLGGVVASEWREPDLHLDRARRLEAVKGRLEALGQTTERRLSDAASAAQQKGVAELDQALADARKQKAAAEKLRRGKAARAKSLLTADADALLQDGEVELEVQYRDAEIAGLTAARDRMAKRAGLAALPADVAAKLKQMQADAAGAEASCRAAKQELVDFEARWEVRATFQLYDRERHGVLQDAARGLCDKAQAQLRAQTAAAELLTRQAKDAKRAYELSRGWADSEISAVTSELDQRIIAERTAAEGSLRARFSLWAEQVHLSKVLKQAVVALALIIVTPFLIRLFCYFVLAPAAARRPAISLRQAGGSGAAIPPADRSTTSVGVRLAAGEELLVRQDYLQTSSEAGAKSTQWLLDWRHPLTSLASGLTFLTRIRGEGEVTTVSAVHDPFAEVTVVTLPPGAACVLQPRALAAVVQPIGERLRVSGHWRLFSLNAWLTMQLRYLVFHGPARLVLQGGRGVRVERAERGRVMGQDQVVGFSTDLAYSVTRTETFWPYFLGREPLLKDRVAAGDGVLIVEEAPRAGRRPGEVRHGIEGMIDAGMKVFGM